MNRYKEAADHFYALADIFNELAGDSASASVSAAGPVAAPPSAAPASTFSDGLPVEEPPEDWQEFAPAPLPAAAPPAGPQGFDAICPAHRKEYKDGRYGPYCTATSDDPKWSNARGYCTVTPKSAAAWLRQHAGAAA